MEGHYILGEQPRKSHRALLRNDSICHYYPPFTEEDAEAQGLPCPRSHSSVGSGIWVFHFESSALSTTHHHLASGGQFPRGGALPVRIVVSVEVEGTSQGWGMHGRDFACALELPSREPSPGADRAELGR